MKKYFLTFLLISMVYTVSAQVPGYQGKRFCLGYNASTFMVMDGGLANFPLGLRVTYKTELSVNYALNRNASIGMSYYGGKQKYDVQSTAVGNYGFYIPETEFVPCRIQMYEFHIQLFRKNFVAPVGIYHQIGIGIIKYNLDMPFDELKLKSSSGYNSSSLIIAAPASDYSGFKLSYHIGKTNPIGHHFYINTALGANFFQGGDIGNFEVYDVSTYNYLLYAFNKNIWKHNFAEIKIGFGWMAF